MSTSRPSQSARGGKGDAPLRAPDARAEEIRSGAGRSRGEIRSTRQHWRGDFFDRCQVTSSNEVFMKA